MIEKVGTMLKQGSFIAVERSVDIAIRRTCILCWCIVVIAMLFAELTINQRVKRSRAVLESIPELKRITYSITNMSWMWKATRTGRRALVQAYEQRNENDKRLADTLGVLQLLQPTAQVPPRNQ